MKWKLTWNRRQLASAGFVQLPLELLVLVSEDLQSVLLYRVPFGFLVPLKVHAHFFDGSQDDLYATVGVALLRLSVVPQDVRDSLVLEAVFKEVPIMRRANLVHELTLLALHLRFLLEHFGILCHQLLHLGNLRIVVVFNSLSDLLRFHSLEALEENIVLDILKHVVVDVLQSLGRVQPLLLVLQVEVSVPDPIPAVLSDLGLKIHTSFLGIVHVGLRVVLLL